MARAVRATRSCPGRRTGPVSRRRPRQEQVLMPRARKTPPNILHVMFDQMAALSLPCYGHPLVKAPNLRALAESGVVFEQAYCNAPLCSPSRHAMMTGQLASRIGVYDNAAE